MIPTRLQRPCAALLASTLMLACSASFGQNASVLQMRALAATCANCHGTEGSAVQGEAMERLAGMPKDYIVAQMQAFRDGRRPATLMHQISKGYSVEQIESLATYFAARK